MNRDVIQSRNDGQQVAAGFKPLAQAVANLIAQLPILGLEPQDQEDVYRRTAPAASGGQHDRYAPSWLRLRRIT